MKNVNRNINSPEYLRDTEKSKIELAVESAVQPNFLLPFGNYNEINFELGLFLLYLVKQSILLIKNIFRLHS